MSDILIRDVPDADVAALDAHAAALGLSRNEYLRRRLHQDARHRAVSVADTDLRRFATLFADLADREVMARAWS
ncbi:MAG TPA: ribbon-helix-helix protein, CopG family [Acidimicrobiales bacterium]